MQSFVLVSEEAISKGIRRIVAITGPEALKSQAKCQALEEQVQNLQNSVQEKMNAKTLKPREAAQEISRLGEVSAYRGPTLDRGKKCRKNEPKRSNLVEIGFTRAQSARQNRENVKTSYQNCLEFVILCSNR